jgi:hypothetical protein
VLTVIRLKIDSLKLFDTISEYLVIRQKTVRQSPIEKLHDAFIAISARSTRVCALMSICGE